MKSRLKYIALAITFILTFQGKAQVSGSDYRNMVASLLPELNLDDKILFINVWKTDNLDSRENNKEFLRVSNIYIGAKLKNGLKGVTYVNLSIDKDSYMWMMSIKRDSIISNYNLENSTGKYDALAKLFGDFPGNVVVGSDGNIIAKDIKKENCFKTFSSLITR